MSTLRGASAVDVDSRRIRGVIVVVCVVVLAVLAGSLFIAGARKNAQIDSLRRNGVPVVVTVTGCRGLLGGSGSNDAGYVCRGTFTLRGRHHVDTIPGDLDRPPGTKVRAVTLSADPGLLATAHQLSTAHGSAKVFVLPSAVALVLLLALVLAAARLLIRRGPGPRRTARRFDPARPLVDREPKRFDPGASADSRDSCARPGP